MKLINDFTEGNILSPLIKFTILIFLSLFLQVMYGTVDLAIVGQFGTAADLSAVSTGSQIMNIITVIIAGFTMGTTILLGQQTGKGKSDDLGKIIGASIALFGMIAIIITVVMLLFARSITELMQVPPEAFEKAVSYIVICSSGTVFIVAYNVISGILRGLGNSKLPLIFVAIACVVNIAGDFFFVAVLHLNTSGVAISTIIAQATSVVLSVQIIKKQGVPFPFKRNFIKFQKGFTTEMLKLGTPIAFQNGLNSISFSIIYAIVNTLGLTASAGIGVAEKIFSFLVMSSTAFMSSISTFTAQNVGARKYDRSEKCLTYGLLFSSIIGFTLFYISFWWGDVLASVFTQEKDVITAAAGFLKATAIECFLVSIATCYLGYFNGIGKTLFVMIQSLFTAFLIRIPVLFYMSQIPNVTMFQLGLAAPISAMGSLIACFVYYYRLKKKTSPNISLHSIEG
ncbi:MAG: MATE family efflux transporter [Bacillota bacterium]|nr:MATE family efflux transporter [Bacillota bacterium]